MRLREVVKRCLRHWPLGTLTLVAFLLLLVLPKAGVSRASATDYRLKMPRQIRLASMATTNTTAETPLRVAHFEVSLPLLS